jgi:hypothetical protein
MVALRAVKERVFSPYFTKYDAEAFLNENLAILENVGGWVIVVDNGRILVGNIVDNNNNSSSLVGNVARQNTKQHWGFKVDVNARRRLGRKAKSIAVEVSRKATRNISEEDTARVVLVAALREFRTMFS